MSFRWLSLLLPLAALAAGDPGAARTKAETRTAWGLHTTTFDTLEGRVIAHLPSDAAAGDTLAGTVHAEPRGEDEETRAANLEKLSGLVVTIAAARAEVGSGSLRATLPPSPGGGSVPIFLEGTGGTGGASADLPIAAAPPSPAAELELPELAQAGRPVSVRGAFDGDLSTTAARLDGLPLQVLAESPRRAVLQVPPDAVGVHELEVRESPAGGTESAATGSLRVLGLSLSADQLDLKRGQTTELRVLVSGLEGLEQPIPLEIRNQSPATVQLKGGETQLIEIGAAGVAEQGEYLWRGTLVGVKPGSFQILATVPSLFRPEPAPPPVADALQDRDPEPDCACQRVEIEAKTSPSTRNTVRVNELRRDGRPVGVSLHIRRNILHRMVCSGERGKCTGSTAWQVTPQRVVLQGMRIDGQPAAPLDSTAGGADQRLGLANAAAGYDDEDAPRPNLTLTADCDECRKKRNAACQEQKSQNVMFRVDALLPPAVLARLQAGASVTFEAIEVTSRWSGMATNCPGPGYNDPQPDRRLQEKPNFSGWKRR